MTDTGDSFDARLAEYDEGLARGAAAGPGLDPRLCRAAGVLGLLERQWPRAAAGADVPTHFGRFRIVRELGRGGCGVVLLAVDPHLDRLVALKLPRPRTLLTPGLRARFLREARAAGGLDHPNIVPVYEVGEAGVFCYIASAHCDGPTLAQWLAATAGPVCPRLAAGVTAALAHAVRHAHARGVLHRDLTPGNVLLAPNPEGVGHGLPFTPRLTDFGLATVIGDDPAGDRGVSVLGTPGYLAPEQAAGRWAEVGPHTDVWGLGGILYAMLVRRPPFPADSAEGTLRRIAAGPLVPPRRLRPDVPRMLDAICRASLRREPRGRYQSARALADDLTRFLTRGTGRPVD